MSEIRVDKISEKTADAGITLKSQGTADNKPMVLTLQTAETDMAANDVIGKIAFQAPDEGTGTDAILVAAAIQARSEGDFSSSANATAIDFMVGASEAAATKMSLSSGGVLTAVELDISGNIDVDGTTNLDVVDIDGAVNMATTALVTGVLTTTAATVFNGGFVANDGSTITTADNTDTLSLISTDADAEQGPNLRLYRNSASPADNDVLGMIDFEGRNDNSQDVIYVQMESLLADASDGTEDGYLNLSVMLAGTLRSRIEMDPGETVINEASQDLNFRVETNNETHAFFLDGGNDTCGFNESVPDTTAGGATFNQGADDGNIISFKSSDIAHGTTGTAETDTFAFFRKGSATNGGITLTALSEGSETIKLNANPTEVLTDQNASTVGTHIISVSKKNGTGSGSTDATSNLLSITNHTNTRFHFRGDGNFYADAGSNTFDEFEDAHLVRAYDLSHGRGVINSKFDKFVSYNHEKLAELDLVGRESDGTPNHFVSVTGFQRLHNGAIWQQYEKTQKLTNAFYKLAQKTIGKEEADKLLTEEEIQLLN